MRTTPSVKMPEMFVVVPSPETPFTTTTVEGTLQTETDVERRPTTTNTTPKAVPTLTTTSGLVYVSAVSIQAMT